jgi:O-antigen ligase
MKAGVAFIAVLSPLIITPGLLFSYDITPKIAVLLVGTCLLLLFSKNNLTRTRSLWRTRLGRWFIGLLAAQWIVVAMAAALSSSRALSLDGSSWRRYGLLTQTCLMLAGLLIAAWIAEDRSRIRTVLRMCTAAGALGAVYGVLQYCGWDPLIPAAAYHAGEGPFMIVRPPGTLGQADYFAAWLVTVFFAALALAAVKETSAGRLAARIAAGLAALAILLSGTRAALLALVAGILILALMRPLRITRNAIALGTAGAVCLIVFYFSPPGARLRARAHWSMEDTWGGARLPLWRDSLAMFAHRPWTGFGPETFSIQFPQFQSLTLARAYPDSYHESPHNMFLDVLTAEGVGGAATMLALTILGFCAYRRLDRKYAAPLIAGWAAFLICNQFIVLIAPTAAYFYLWLAMLVGSDAPKLAEVPQPSRSSWTFSLLAAAAGLVFMVYMVRLMAADKALADMRAALESGEAQQAAQAYQRAAAWQPEGAEADLYYSRGMAALAARSLDPHVRLMSSQQAVAGGARAVRVAEDRQNAWYNMAALFAAQNDAVDAERCLRNAISVAPNWFKPHWTLARLLALSHRNQEALDQASAAVERDGGHNAEVLETWNQLRQESSTGHQP